MMKRITLPAFVGFIDASYLTYEHYARIIPPCMASFFADCGKVLQSSYAVPFGIPLALIGVIYYCILIIIALFTGITGKRTGKYMLLLLTAAGFMSSIYFVYLQLVVIKAICIYCMISALISTILFVIVQSSYGRERQVMILGVMAFIYQNLIKKYLFTLDPEFVHTNMTSFGELLGKYTATKWIFSQTFIVKDPSLSQEIAGIDFRNPIGLAAGFDYEGKLTQILSATGFGFQTVGTITHMSYEGNPRPMLGRLPLSRSLMVNKGFKNPGAAALVKKLSELSFGIPVGISIGRTNSAVLKTQKESIEDIIKAFTAFEESKVQHSYYELNISCPNLYGDITFYPPRNLRELLTEVDRMDLKRPVFIKMPIEKSDSEVLSMLEVITNHSPAGVIFGNLQKDRHNPALVQKEVKRFKTGAFSGKPTFERSNELISLSYRHYRQRLVIIGCGGVFSGADAYRKIALGASLVQLITGMIFQGPQLIARINTELVDYMQKVGVKNISELTGSSH